jgi:PIN domain nuclease of toxin-antitoxin system
MWYAITANPINLKSKEKKKEFFTREHEVILSAESQAELEIRLRETEIKFPEEFKRYLQAGIKIVEANNIIQAKRLSKKINIYFDDKGQYHLL